MLLWLSRLALRLGLFQIDTDPRPYARMALANMVHSAASIQPLRVSLDQIVDGEAKGCHGSGQKRDLEGLAQREAKPVWSTLSSGYILSPRIQMRTSEFLHGHPAQAIGTAHQFREEMASLP